MLTGITQSEFGTDGVTVLAMQLEACMLMDTAAQERYLAIYGEAWVSLYDIQCEAKRSVAVSTTCNTVAGKAR
jgi:hypothetical protein